MPVQPERDHTYLVRSGHGPFKMRVLEVDPEFVKGIIKEVHTFNYPDSPVKYGGIIVIRRCNASFYRP